MSRTGTIITDRTNAIRHMAGRLGGLAGAFERTGNQTVADELDHLARAISEAAQEIHGAYYDEVTTSTRQSLVNGERFMGAILQGVLSGKSPKDACLEGAAHHLDRDLIEARENSPPPNPRI